jgi:hypothetical protein
MIVDESKFGDFLKKLFTAPWRTWCDNACQTQLAAIEAQCAAMGGTLVNSSCSCNQSDYELAKVAGYAFLGVQGQCMPGEGVPPQKEPL